jgi:uncharacterized protein (TIGR02996 family)
MTPEDAFLQAIAESPDEGQRLIYADWLEDNGQPERAELIRVQVELAKLPEGDPRRHELEARERGLLAVYEVEWARPLLGLVRGLVSRWGFRRGFIEELTVEARGLVLHARGMFRLAPLRHLSVYLAHRHIREVAALPQLARLVSLDLDQNYLGDEGVAFLAASPHLGGLANLSVRYNGIRNAGGLALAGSARLAGLTSLDLRGNRLGNQAQTALRVRFGSRVQL